MAGCRSFTRPYRLSTLSTCDVIYVNFWGGNSTDSSIIFQRTASVASAQPQEKQYLPAKQTKRTASIFNHKEITNPPLQHLTKETSSPVLDQYQFLSTPTTRNKWKLEMSMKTSCVRSLYNHMSHFTIIID